jgi:hypothetical protein
VTTTNGFPRPPRRRRVAVGALLASALGLAAVVASSPAPAAPSQSATAKVGSARAASTRTASSVHPATTPNCPKSTYPTGPTSKTGYGIAFTAVLLDGALNGGYHETPDPGVYDPWGLHIGNLTGTVCGLIELPSLNLSATPSDIQIGTYGQMSGPGELQPGQTGNFSFTGIADPGANQVGFNVAGYVYGTLGSENDTGTQGVAYYDTGHPQELSVSNILLKSTNEQAGAPPGPSIPDGEKPAGGTFTLTNNSGQAVTDIQGEEPDGFIGGGKACKAKSGEVPLGTCLNAGQSATYTWTAVGVSTGAQNVPLSLTGETATGRVTGSAFAYFFVKSASLGPALAVGNIRINGVPASSAPGPALAPGSVFTTTFTVTDNSPTYPVWLCDTTNGTCAAPDTDSASDQFPSVLAVLSVPGQNPYGYSPFLLYGFSLSVDVPCTPGTSGEGAACPADLYTTPDGVCGASDMVPPNYCLPPNALSAKGVAAADASFSTVNPAITCDQDVSVDVTTGRSTVVPKQVTGADRNLPVWTVEGQGLAGPLIGAEGEVVSNDFGLTVNNDSGGCFPYDGEFDQIAGGVTPPHDPICKEPQNVSGESYCYYNGANPADIAISATDPAEDPSSCLIPANHVFCGPPGELQLSAEVVVTSIDLPTYHETVAARRG